MKTRFHPASVPGSLGFMKEAFQKEDGHRLEGQ
jgi:hypothetical protein